MTGLVLLWLPIVLSAVVVFLASSVIHMMLRWHKSDYQKVPNEDKVRDALRAFAIPPADYMIPCPSSMEEMRNPEFAEKVKQGPNLVMAVMPTGSFSMTQNLVNWFLYSLVVGVFCAYVAGRALPPGAEYLRVFQLVGAVAFIGYSLALWQMSIWYHRSLGTTIRSTIDGLVYALLTAGVFGWRWPHLS